MRFHTANKDKIPINRGRDVRYRNQLVYKRPFIDQFMQFCFERFEVAIWFTSMERNVDGVLDSAIGEMRSKQLFVWDQRKCIDSGYKSLEKEGRPLFLKAVEESFWDHFKTVSKREMHYSASPNTAIFPETYIAEDQSDRVLDPKGELGLYLDGLAAANDVRTYVKEHPFGQPGITPNHPDWRFYSIVLRHLQKQKICVDETGLKFSNFMSSSNDVNSRSFSGIPNNVWFMQVCSIL